MYLATRPLFSSAGHGVVFLQGKGFNDTDDENRMGFMHVGVQQFHDEDQPKMYRSN